MYIKIQRNIRCYFNNNWNLNAIIKGTTAIKKEMRLARAPFQRPHRQQVLGDSQLQVQVARPRGEEEYVRTSKSIVLYVMYVMFNL